jgi:membrane protein DedA with SNARE-associated domain
MSTMPQHLPAFIHTLEPVVNQYGYLVVGSFILLEDFGLPTPGETVLITASFYAGYGHLDIWLVIVIAFIAAVIGDNIGYLIGSRGGRPLLERFGKYVFMTPERIDKAESFFNRHGGKVVIIARFIEGLRQANGIIAGISTMPWRRFIGFNIIGAALWVGTWSAVGYFGGSHIDAIVKYELYIVTTIFVALGVYVGIRLIRSRRKQAR